LLLYHQHHRRLTPSTHYYLHLTVQHQPDDQGKDSVFTSNTDVSVINLMKNKEGDDQGKDSVFTSSIVSLQRARKKNPKSKQKRNEDCEMIMSDNDEDIYS
jgi:hypothetical protein